MRLKKVMALVMTGTLAASALTACSSGKDNGSTTQAEANGGTEKESSAEQGAEKTVINIWTKNRHDATYVQAKVDEYNKTNTDNIEVVYTLYTDNYKQAVDMAAQNGELPDILVQQNQVFDSYFSNGQWADLYQFMDDDMKEYFADVITPGYNEIDGKLYFIPTTGSTCRLFYNTEIFERVGIENPPTTLEEMVEDAKLITSQLKSEGIYGFAQNMKSASSALARSMVVGLQRETGMPWGYDFAKGEYNFNNWADTLNLWKELLSEECAFPGCESLDIDPLRTQFAAGKIGMYFSYSAAEPGVYENQFPMDSSKWNAAPIPTVGGKETGKQAYEGTGAYLLNAKSPNLEKAFKVYKDIFTSEEYQIGYYEGGYGVSIIPSVLEKANPSENYKKKEWLRLNPEYDAILPKPPHSAFTSGMIVEGEDMYKTCESIYYGDADVTSTLQDLTDRYNKAYQDAVANGTGYEIKIDHYDPKNPTIE